MPVDLVKLVSQERVQQRTAEVPVDLVKLVSQERVQQRTAEVPVDLGEVGLTGTSATAGPPRCRSIW